MRNLCFHPMFLVGLVIRILLIASLTPATVSDWYAPFLKVSVSAFTSDPWAAWIRQGGASNAFPYGYAMWLSFLPTTLASELLSFPTKFAYDLGLLVADFCLLATLSQLLPNRQRLVLGTYWLSPVVVLASYALGLNDLIPVAFLMLAMLFLKRVELKLAGVACAVAISAKLSMIIALPFFVIYLYNNKSLRQIIGQFLGGFGVSALVLGLPFLFSRDGLSMLINNPELVKIYSLSLHLNEGFSVYMVPFMYVVLLYATWRVGRLNFELFQAITGVTLLVIVLLTPASSGWYVWSLPFLVLYQAMSGRVAIALIAVFSLFFIISTLLSVPLIFANGARFDLAGSFYAAGRDGGHLASLLHTGNAAIGLILAIRIWRETVTRSDFFRLSRKPFVIGIAGDSGAGKDTFSDSIEGLFGSHSVSTLSGDDYHLWDRHKPMWQVLTHLNPLANDLEGFSKDLVALTDGRCFQSRHYDHQTGKMSRPYKRASNDFIIASGLHALYLPILREIYNLKIYLDIDEGLRKHYKIRRDVFQRGHTVERVLDSFEKRESDSQRYIRPQSNHADLTFALRPIHVQLLEKHDQDQPIRLRLGVKTRHGFNEISLHRVLVGICGLHVDMDVSSDSAEVQITIDGDISATDISIAAKILCPQVFEFLDINPQWKDGMLGVMQLITISKISQVLNKRFLQ